MFLSTRLPSTIRNLRFALAVTVSAGCTVVADGSPSDEPYPLHARVVKVLAGERPFEARLSGSTEWVECGLRTTDGVCAGYRPNLSVLSKAGGHVVEGRKNSASSNDDVVWSAAVVDLASVPKDEQVDAIIDRLTALVDDTPQNASARNDLAVAYLAADARMTDVQHRFDALEQIERAAESDSASPVIAFNRALILERLLLYKEADAAWTGYLRRDSSSGWSVEARRRLAEIRRTKETTQFNAHSTDVREQTLRDPQGAREHVLEVLVDAWARASKGGDEAARSRSIASMVSIGAILLERSGDSTVLHIAQSCDRSRGDAYAAAADMIEGMVDFRAERYAVASPKLQRATRKLRADGAGSLAGWGEVMSGGISMYAGKYAIAESQWKAVERDARQRGDLALRARAHWALGLAASKQGNTAQALDFSAAAESLYQVIGERGNNALMLSQLADIYFLLGRDDAWLDAKVRSLAGLNTRRDFVRRFNLLMDFGKQIGELGLPGAAIAFLREGEKSAAQTGRPSDRAEALLRLGHVEFASGREAAGRTHLTLARRALESVGDSTVRAFLSMEAAAADATVASATSPTIAVARLTEVMDYYRKQSLFYGRALPLAERAHNHLIAGDTTAAENDLADAEVTIASHADKPASRATARDVAAVRRAVFQELVAIDVARHDTVHAFLNAEQGRGNRIEHVPESGAGRVILSYEVLPKELLLFAISGRSLRMVRVPVKSDSLRQMVFGVVRSIQAGATTADSIAERTLYDLLITPARAEVRTATELVIVPDGPLGTLPFGALRGENGRYMIENVLISFASHVGAERTRTAKPGLVTIVGNPSFDAALFPELVKLSGADSETRAVSGVRTRAELIEGTRATKPAVLEALRTSAVLHFAGHARRVERAPSLSHLVLARAQGGLETNALSAAEIATHDLRHLQLVILSSCGTSQRASLRNDGQSGLSTAFLDAGAGAVISSMWEADDKGTAQLMVAVHRQLVDGKDPAIALHLAQIEMIRSGNQSRRVWGAFRIERQ